VAPVAAPVAPLTRPQGFLDDLMDKLEGKGSNKDAWKEEMYREQQEILKRRRKTGGFIDEEQEKEIRDRRNAVAAEQNVLKDVQQKAGNKDVLEDWKKARDAGKFRTATKGLQRDAKSCVCVLSSRDASTMCFVQVAPRSRRPARCGARRCCVLVFRPLAVS